jgi:lipopolysaccharide export system protein LptC
VARGPGLYSRIVAILKVGLPLVALGLLAGLFLISTEDEIDGNLVFSEADLEALDSGMQVTRPTFTGSSRDNDRFRFTADRVVPDAAPPTRAHIVDLAGRIDFAGGPTVDVAAPEAALDLDTNVLELAGRVTLDSSDGYHVVSDRMTVDLRAGSLAAKGDVVGEGPMGRIDSETMRVDPAEGEDADRRFSFGDGVRLVYDPAEND